MTRYALGAAVVWVVACGDPVSPERAQPLLTQPTGQTPGATIPMTTGGNPTPTPTGTVPGGAGGAGGGAGGGGGVDAGTGFVFGTPGPWPLTNAKYGAAQGI